MHSPSHFASYALYFVKWQQLLGIQYTYSIMFLPESSKTGRNLTKISRK